MTTASELFHSSKSNSTYYIIIIPKNYNFKVENL